MRYLIALTLSVYMAFQPAFATLNEVDKTNIFSKNMLKNGGFENGKASWTASAGTFAVTTSSPMVGLQHATWDAAASADTLTSGDITIPAGYFGRNGVGSCVFTTASGTATHEIQIWDGASILSETTITSSTTPTRTSVNFIYPSSSSVAVRIYANADEPSVAIDDCYLGPAEGYNVSSVSQATFVGGMEQVGAASCSYSESTSTGLSDFDDIGTGSGCNAWTVVSNGPGTISAQGTNDHRLVYTNMPHGNYTIKLTGLFNKSADAACVFRLSDGTNTYQVQGLTSSAAGSTSINSLEFYVSLSSAASKTYKLQAADSIVGSCSWLNDDANLNASWKIYRFPTSSEQAYTPDLQAMSWSGYHDDTCSWARTSTSLGDPTADASCALVERTNQNFGTVSTSGSVLPAITFTPKKAGRYYVCAHAQAAATGATTMAWKLWDGTTTIFQGNDTVTAATSYYVKTALCGIYVASNTSAKTISIQSASTAGTTTMANGAASSPVVEWSIFSLDQSLPAPVLTNMVTTSASGGLRIETFAFGGAVEGTNNCGSTPCTLYRNTAGISSVTRASTGTYTFNFVAGTFSAPPVCSGTLWSIGAAYTYMGPSAVPTTTTFTVQTNDGGTPTLRDSAGYVTCIGAR